MDNGKLDCFPCRQTSASVNKVPDQQCTNTEDTPASCSYITAVTPKNTTFTTNKPVTYVLDCIVHNTQLFYLSADSKVYGFTASQPHPHSALLTRITQRRGRLKPPRQLRLAVSPPGGRSGAPRRGGPLQTARLNTNTTQHNSWTRL